MTKYISYQAKRPDNVRKNQEDAQNATIYILKQYGPTFYLLQDHTEQKYKVYLGDVHTCSCDNFTKDRELCIHLCWMLVKRFKVDPNNPISWQPGLVEREISALLDGQHSLVNKVTSVTESTILSENKLHKKLLFNIQRKIEENDICPICQDYFFSQIRLPVTFCRINCGNSVHIRCMKVWTDYQRKQNSLGSLDYIKCPVCREDFAPLHILLREFTESLNAENKKSTKHKPIPRMIIIGQESDVQQKLNLETIQAKHLNTRCLSCLCSPILGNIYRCEICYQLEQKENLNPFLCSNCFRCDKHLQHNLFVYRETPYGKWLDVPPNRGNIRNLSGQLINKLQDTSENFQLSSTENCNHLLSSEKKKPLELAELAQIRQWTIKLPRNQSEFIISKTSESENINDNKSELVKRMSPISSTGLLTPGRQCLLCLMSFKVNDKVRQLSPGCQHIFHSDCIDPWLLHK
ncbi:E3 ubiquitin-protein ligase ZSWIM2 isoform 2 [Schistosoma japonicum]|nr:E3 ubiquitin-protein ligase ZSWIM2 isoform 2 [Schistosoma japonicum]TNN10639.1 E3 ubiquitin-protein ligase ZSWIM2 isoform 2 [Schistosoma japonicum]